MKHRLIIVLLLLSITTIHVQVAAQDSCLYCGVWVPFSEKYTTPYSANDRLIITEQTVALPGCSPTKSTQVFFTDKSGDDFPFKNSRIKPVKTLLRLEQPIICIPERHTLSQGILIEIKLKPRGYENSEEIELVFFNLANFEDIKASYANQSISTKLSVKPTIKRSIRPTELGGWWFIREEYDPCDEGTGHGAWICAAIKHKKADEDLNTEWKRLLTVISPDKKRNIIFIQNKWLKACSIKCAKEGIDKGHHPWGLAHETLCLAEEKTDRSQQFKVLFDCLSTGKRDCPQLKDKP